MRPPLETPGNPIPPHAGTGFIGAVSCCGTSGFRAYPHKTEWFRFCERIPSRGKWSHPGRRGAAPESRALPGAVPTTGGCTGRGGDVGTSEGEDGKDGVAGQGECVQVDTGG